MYRSYHLFVKCDQDSFPETCSCVSILDSSNPVNSSVTVLGVEELLVVFEVGTLMSFRFFSVFPSGRFIGLNCSIPDLLDEARSMLQEERVHVHRCFDP